MNALVAGHEVDFHWPEAGLMVETDGGETHATRAAFERDRARDARLTALGWRVVHFTYRQVAAEPGRVGTLLAELLVPGDQRFRTKRPVRTSSS
jgi:very-short-patch-repair endonuclease